ncbi:hypothetical protein EVAR_101346_1 [Eumeta japonica]|uniref:Uncharacterized protein n=1 Tax=Eumeta variegata TaxID=151549 RepID=A0A4C1SSW4_EUMVA|nr:hypothetical protein EVAR_101346_1 [Eumeta japonica]
MKSSLQACAPKVVLSYFFTLTKRRAASGRGRAGQTARPESCAVIGGIGLSRFSLPQGASVWAPPGCLVVREAHSVVLWRRADQSAAPGREENLKARAEDGGDPCGTVTAKQRKVAPDRNQGKSRRWWRAGVEAEQGISRQQSWRPSRQPTRRTEQKRRLRTAGEGDG